MQSHISPLPAFVEQVSYSALYFFFLVAGYFHGSLGERGARWLGKRFVRLAVPYAVWSVVFIAWWNLYHFIRGWPPYLPDPVRVVFFAGGTEVLWSLPWLFTCAALAEVFVRTPTLRRSLLVVAAAVQLCVWIFVPMSALPQYGIRQFIEGGRWVVLYLAGMEVRGLQSVWGSALGWTVTAIVADIAAGTLAVAVGPQPTTLMPEIVMFVLKARLPLIRAVPLPAAVNVTLPLSVLVPLVPLLIRVS